MNKSQKIYHRVVGVRLTETDTTNLDRICAALGVTPSEFVRRKIKNINNTIMNKNIFNISESPATDAWGRDVAKMQQQKEKEKKQVMNQVAAMMDPPAEPQPKEVKKTLPKPVVKAEPAATIFNVKGYFGHFNTKFNMFIQAATKEKAADKAKSFHGLPGRVVTVTSTTLVTAASVNGKHIHKA